MKRIGSNNVYRHKAFFPPPAAATLPLMASLLLLLACGFSFSLSGCSDGSPPNRPNVLLISLDTLRADHLGCYGYERPTSPFLDSLIMEKEVVLFEDCSAQAPTTTPSHMTLFTSLYPTVHGAGDQPTKMGKPKTTVVRGLKTLAEHLRDAGYRTAGIADGGNLNPVFGFAQGFETYRSKYEGAAAKVDQAMAWLSENGSGEEPFFLFLHTYEIHAPYMPPHPFDEKFTGDYDGWVKHYAFAPDSEVRNTLRGFTGIFERKKELTDGDVEYLEALYDGEIAFTDQELERLWLFLQGSMLLDNLLVIILSDHGEAFGEHGAFEHTTLFNEIVHVPLIIRFPPNQQGIGRRRVTEAVSIIDVMPTLLDLLSIGEGRTLPLQGRSLRPLWEGGIWDGKRPIIGEAIQFEALPPFATTVRVENMKLLNYMMKKNHRLFDLKSDPGESADLLQERPGDEAVLTRILKDVYGENLKLRNRFKCYFTDKKLDPDVYDELKQLGY